MNYLQFYIEIICVFAAINRQKTKNVGGKKNEKIHLQISKISCTFAGLKFILYNFGPEFQTK